VKIALYNLTTTTLWGGVETFNREMAKALAKKGHTVHIYGGKNGLIHDLPAEVTTYLYPYVKRSSVPNLGSRFRKFVERLSFGMFAYRDLITRGMITCMSPSPSIFPLRCYAHIVERQR